jgi:hypothetical protein
VPTSYIGEVEQGGGDMDQDETRWSSQRTAMTQASEEGDALGFNHNSHALYTSTAQGHWTRPGLRARPVRLWASYCSQVKSSRSCAGPSWVGAKKAWSDFIYCFQ